MWVWRKIEKISWRDMKTNEEVLQVVQEERGLMDVIWRRKKNWIRGESLRYISFCRKRQATEHQPHQLNVRRSNHQENELLYNHSLYATLSEFHRNYTVGMKTASIEPG